MVHRWRYWVIIGGMLLFVTGLVWRMVDLMLLDRSFLLGQGNARSLRVVSIPAYRGIITDRNGAPLAVSTPVDSVWIDPQEFDLDDKGIPQLAEILNMQPEEIVKLAKTNDEREFVYLQRGLNPFIAEQVKALNMSGVYLQRDYRRYYPEGEITAQLLGFTSVDDQGQEGIELEYNNWLQGVPGRKQVLKDRLGRVVTNIDLMRAAQPGRTLVLSIDRRIQYLAYTELEEAVRNFHAASGSVIVLDANTGEILAMVNQPSFNPNNRPALHDGRFRNRAVTDVFEPGSTTKSFSVANALISGRYKPDTIIDTRPGYMMVAGKKIEDEDDYGVLTVTGVLQHSSNVGVSKITLSLPPDLLWQLLSKVGYGQRTASGFPGESSGVLMKYKTWHPFTLATLSFGYGLSITNLQLAQAYSVLASGGVKRPVSLLKVTTRSEGERVIPAKIANVLVTMLQSVVNGEGGTGSRARIPGYTVSGKTGTVRVVGNAGYEKNHHNGIFVGMAPASNPQLVVSVVIRDPQGQYMGGLVSAPVFAKVMGGALRILNIPPDNLQPQQVANEKT